MKLKQIVLALAAAVALSSVAAAPALAASITVAAHDAEHTYVAYQVFTGTQQESEGELGNVAWGADVDADALLAALQAPTETAFAAGEGSAAVANVFSDCSTAADVALALSTFADNSAAAERFAKLALAHICTAGTTLTAAVTELADGYYLIADTTDVAGAYDVANPAVLQVTGNITIQAKTDLPTVDKLVWDEPADMEPGHAAADGWGETADHELGEIFPFKLIATLPASTQFARYDAYEVKFTDTWSAGVSYDGNLHVLVDGAEIDGALYTATADAAMRTLTVDISNIKAVPEVDLTDGAVVEVIYDAHLNADAIVANAASIANLIADDNQNAVYLEFSNKPDATGLGKTTQDFVFVFTYETVNTKFAGEPNDARDNALPGAAFKLYKTGANDTLLWAVLDGNKLVTWVSDELAASEVTSGTDGKFSFVGLDAGTYFLRESQTPAGYNTCDDITVQVSATHAENADAISATVAGAGAAADPTVYADVINNKGTELPETGGVGTTIFYLVGGLLMAAGVVFFVVRRKMSSFDK